jgi:hypothetical protein
VQDAKENCVHNVGAGGNMLVDLEYRAIGYPSYISKEEKVNV